MIKIVSDKPALALVKIYPVIMSVIFLLIIFSLLLAILFLFAFIWSVKDGQYEDDYTPSVRILFDDGPKESKSEI